MLSDEKLWLKNNFENEPDVGFPGYYSLISGYIFLKIILLTTVFSLRLKTIYYCVHKFFL